MDLLQWLVMYSTSYTLTQYTVVPRWHTGVRVKWFVGDVYINSVMFFTGNILAHFFFMEMNVILQVKKIQEREGRFWVHFGCKL